MKRPYRTASIVTTERVVFSMKGNDSRLVAAVDYEKSIANVGYLSRPIATTHRRMAFTANSAVS